MKKFCSFLIATILVCFASGAGLGQREMKTGEELFYQPFFSNFMETGALLAILICVVAGVLFLARYLDSEFWRNS